MNLQGRNLNQDLRGDDVRLLQTELAQLGLPVPDDERQQALFGPRTRDAVMRFQKANHLPVNGVVDPETATLINQAVDSLFTLSGSVYSKRSPATAGLQLVVVDKNAGPDVILGRGTTDEAGSYSIRFSAAPVIQAGKPAPDLQVMAVAGGQTLAKSDVHYGAGANEQLDIVLPDEAASVLTHEHGALISAIAKHFQGAPADLQENGDRSDVTYLANKTGWDARAVAMASLADQFTRNHAPDVPPQWFYALFRAGLPADENTLFRVGSDHLARAWKAAAEQGIIPSDAAAQIPDVAQRFQNIAARKILTGPALTGVSPLSDMLSAAGVDNAEAQNRFAQLYTQHNADPAALWRTVSETLGAEVSARLQVHGKLALLTVNNAPVMRVLNQIGGEAGLTDPVQLAQSGLHRAEKWEALIPEGMEIPKEIPGDDPASKRANYASFMAAQVRLSYPTASIAEMVGAGDLAVAAPDSVAAFLNEHHGKFEIGAQPVEQYIARNQLDVAAQTVTGVKQIQRVYQITSNDRAMSSLLKAGITSAYQVAQQDRETFVLTHTESLGSAQAAAVHDRSVEIHNATLNVAVSYLTARSGFQLGAAQTPGLSAAVPALAGQIMQPAPKGPSAANADDIIAYPTLEQLFGSMDFCACDECRSIFSPAAYLVDLLQFLDNAADGKRNAQEVLFERRPDIQHLPLTCENTNTALPYIDVVNEALEYYIANGVQALSLKGYQGHNTGSVATEDLMASPQYVMDTAYDILRSNTFFPPPLPFHQPLENVRRLFDAFDVPLELAMERLRKNDDVERGANPYGWRDILMEEVGLSREEYRILTDSAIGLKALYGFPDAKTDAEVSDALSNAKLYCRRVKITYDDLVALLQKRFVNPNADLIPRLEGLGVSFATLAALHDEAISDAAFGALLPQGAGAPDPAQYGGDIKGWVKNDGNFARIMGILTLTDPTGSASGCKFDNYELRYSKPVAGPDDKSTRLGAPEFVRLLRFIRLWRTTGWSMEQTDAALCALFRNDLAPLKPDDVASLASLDSGFATFIPRLGNVLRIMKALNLNAKRDLTSLLACWSEMGTFGNGSLYRQLFLNPAVLNRDDAFADNGFGNFPKNPAEKLAKHREVLRSAAGLTADELDRILAAVGFDDDTTLTVAHITAIYRRGWLARKLRFSVRELLLLSSLTGLDPFAAPDPPSSPMLRLIALVQGMKARGLKSVAALYLLWNQDLSGKSAPPPDSITEFGRSLRADFAAIDDQFAAVEDPGGDVARARMALVYGQEAADAFFALLEGAVVLNASYTQAAAELDPAAIAVDGQLAYDRFRHILSHRGLLDAATRDALKNVVGVSNAFKDAVDALFARSEDIRGSFFGRFPELQPLFNIWNATPGTPAQKRTALLAAFSPELARRRKREQALQRLATAAAVDLSFAQALVAAPAAPFPLHAAADPAQSALIDVMVIETRGLAARFFFRDTATRAVDRQVAAAANLAYSAANPLPVNPAPGAISGIWEGRVEAPESGFFNIVIDSDLGSTVTLVFDGEPQPLVRFGTASRNSNPLQLKAGVLYDFTLTVEKVTNALTVNWESPQRAREAIPGRYLYAPSILQPFRDVYVRFLKAAALASALKLTANEMVFFTSSGWLNSLAVTGDPQPANAAALLDPLEQLLDFTRIKSDVSPDDEQLLAILKDPAAATAGRDALLFSLTHWDKQSLDDLLTNLGANIAGLTDFTLFRRIYDAFDVVATLGISAAAAIRAATNNPDGAVARDFSAALRARYDLESWRDVVKPINNQMRSLQRNALVAYILHQMIENPATAHIDTPDKLFEYFLMDVQMEPCMQTSRIRHALSTVQLFTERCLMNLEAEVSPGAINAKRWAWMKRFRPWQVPRMLYVWPENWMEPELRDDKSPFFKEIESRLLQSDIDEETAASALQTYLSRLEEVMQLEPCGVHYIEPTEQSDDVMHVVARTHGLHRKYFYRRYEHGFWTPWEPVKIDIADNPAVPIVWQDRLLLFHTRLLQKGPNDSQRPPGGKKLTELSTSDVPGDASYKLHAVLCWSEYHNGQWQPIKTSNLHLPAEIDEGRLDYLLTSGEIQWKIVNRSGPLRIAFDTSNPATFVMQNTHGAPVIEYTIPPLPPRHRLFDRATEFGISYRSTGGQWTGNRILTAQQFPDVVEPTHELNDTWNAPFFYQDNVHVFLVTSQSDLVRIHNYGRFGANLGAALTAPSAIPPLVQQTPPVPKPKPWDKIAIDPGRVADVGPMQRYITEDAYIRKGLGTIGNVRLNGNLIGPSGSLSTVKEAH